MATLDLRAPASNLELEALLAPEVPPAFNWKTMNWQGDINGSDAVRSMVTMVGSSFERTFLIIERQQPPAALAQCGGSPWTGLVVEVALGTAWPRLDTREGAAESPRLQVGHPRWTYSAASEELHNLSAAMDIFTMWLTEFWLPFGMVTRSARSRW